MNPGGNGAFLGNWYNASDCSLVLPAILFVCELDLRKLDGIDFLLVGREIALVETDALGVGFYFCRSFFLSIKNV